MRLFSFNCVFRSTFPSDLQKIYSLLRPVPYVKQNELIQVSLKSQGWFTEWGMTKCGAINRPSSTVYKYVHLKINNIHTYSTPKYYPLYYLHYSQNWLSLVKRNIFHKSVIFLTGILKTPNIGIYIVKYLCRALTLSIQLSGQSLNFTYGQ